MMKTFFLITAATLLSCVSSLNAQLPESSITRKAHKQELRVELILAEGKVQYLFLGEKISLSALDAKFKAAKEQEADTALCIAAPKDCDWAHIATLIKMAAQAGLTNIIFEQSL